MIGRLSSNKDVILLGPPTCRSRLAIFSFVIRERRSQLFLHHNFVSVLLNDLFGIQSRAGCACAGPYAQSLLGIDENVFLICSHLYALTFLLSFVWRLKFVTLSDCREVPDVMSKEAVDISCRCNFYDCKIVVQGKEELLIAGLLDIFHYI